MLQIKIALAVTLMSLLKMETIKMIAHRTFQCQMALTKIQIKNLKAKDSPTLIIAKMVFLLNSYKKLAKRGKKENNKKREKKTKKKVQSIYNHYLDQAKLALAEVMDQIFSNKDSYSKHVQTIKMCLGYLKDGSKFHRFLNQVIGIQVSNIQSKIWEYSQNLLKSEISQPSLAFFQKASLFIYEQFLEIQRACEELLHIIYDFLDVVNPYQISLYEESYKNIDKKMFAYLVNSDDTLRQLVAMCCQKVEKISIQQKLQELVNILQQQKYEYNKSESSQQQQDQQDDQNYYQHQNIQNQQQKKLYQKQMKRIEEQQRQNQRQKQEQKQKISANKQNSSNQNSNSKDKNLNNFDNEYEYQYRYYNEKELEQHLRQTQKQMNPNLCDGIKSLKRKQLLNADVQKQNILQKRQRQRKGLQRGNKRQNRQSRYYLERQKRHSRSRDHQDYDELYEKKIKIRLQTKIDSQMEKQSKKTEGQLSSLQQEINKKVKNNSQHLKKNEKRKKQNVVSRKTDGTIQIRLSPVEVQEAQNEQQPLKQLPQPQKKPSLKTKLTQHEQSILKMLQQFSFRQQGRLDCRVQESWPSKIRLKRQTQNKYHFKFTKQ